MRTLKFYYKTCGHQLKDFTGGRVISNFKKGRYISDVIKGLDIAHIVLSQLLEGILM